MCHHGHLRPGLAGSARNWVRGEQRLCEDCMAAGRTWAVSLAGPGLQAIIYMITEGRPVLGTSAVKSP